MNNPPPRPKPPLTVVDTTITKNHPTAVYLDIVFKDSDGKLWKASHADFLYNLKELSDENRPANN